MPERDAYLWLRTAKVLLELHEMDAHEVALKAFLDTGKEGSAGTSVGVPPEGLLEIET